MCRLKLKTAKGLFLKVERMFSASPQVLVTSGIEIDFPRSEDFETHELDASVMARSVSILKPSSGGTPSARASVMNPAHNRVNKSLGFATSARPSWMLPSGPMAIRTDRGASSSLFILRFLLTATFDSFFRVSHTWQFLFCHGVPEQASTQVFC